MVMVIRVNGNFEWIVREIWENLREKNWKNENMTKKDFQKKTGKMKLWQKEVGRILKKKVVCKIALQVRGQKSHSLKKPVSRENWNKLKRDV